jgi:hypothetical protein
MRTRERGEFVEPKKYFFFEKMDYPQASPQTFTPRIRRTDRETLSGACVLIGVAFYLDYNRVAAFLMFLTLAKLILKE